MTLPTPEQIRDRIIHMMRIYPTVSPSMIPNFVGPGIPAKIWKPILAEMVADQTIITWSELHENPNGRMHTYTIYALKDLPPYRTVKQVPLTDGRMVDIRQAPEFTY